MKYSHSFTTAVLSAIFLASCATDQQQIEDTFLPPPPQLPDPKSGPAYTAAGHKTQHGLDLFLHIAKQKQENICLSPYSASMALALIRPGARGETLRQIDRTIGSVAQLNTQAYNTALPLEVANRAYISNRISLNPDYQVSLPKDNLSTIDFSANPGKACADINQWVAERTHGRINGILSPQDITPLTRLILVNAIYTRAKWENPFQPENTMEQNFHLETGRTILWPTLNATNAVRYLSRPDCEIVAIPFQSRPGTKDTCMIAILPKKGIAIGKHLAALTPAALQNIRTSLAKEHPQLVKIDIPKFKTAYNSNLAAGLTATGMPNAFNPATADFSGISGTPLCIDFVKQNTWFEMKEEGVEAAAATSIDIVWCCGEEPVTPKTPPHFKADRPFIWMIADIDPETTPYFIGVLRNPAS